MSSSTTPPEELYKPFHYPAAQTQQQDPAVTQQQQQQQQPPYPHEDAPATTTTTYQAYRPPSAQKDSQVPENAANTTASGPYRPYHIASPPPPQAPPAPAVFEMSAEPESDHRPVVPIINIQHPTPTSSIASSSRPSTIIQSPQEGRVPHPLSNQYSLHDANRHDNRYDDDENDDLYIPPLPSRPHENDEGEKVPSLPPLPAKVPEPKESSDQLIDQIGNMLISGGVSHHATTYTPAKDELPSYHQAEQEGVSLAYQPVHDEKKPVASYAEEKPVVSTYDSPAYNPPAPSQPVFEPPPPPPQPVFERPYTPPKAFTPPTVSPIHTGPASPAHGFTSSVAFDVPDSPVSPAESEAPPPLPPRHNVKQDLGDDDPSSPVHYARDPHKLIAYVVPFPKPCDRGQPIRGIPDRYLIYTPPPPPLSKPREGEREGTAHKIQRKWQEELRAAKTSKAKTVSLGGLRSKAAIGLDWAMSQAVSSNTDFLNRLTEHPRSSRTPSPGRSSDASGRPKSSSGRPKSSSGAPNTTSPETDPLALDEIVLVYPASIAMPPTALRAEFVNTLLRSQSNAERDAVIASGEIPASLAADILSTPVWPFGGLLEIDSVWAYTSMRGAKIARSTTKRLLGGGANADRETGSSTRDIREPVYGNPNNAAAVAAHQATVNPSTASRADPYHTPSTSKHLKLTFTPSYRVNILQRYLDECCFARDATRFPKPGSSPTPTESDVLHALGWAPEQTGGRTGNWEDEQWQIQDVKDDLKTVMRKGAREWTNWCRTWEKDPKKAGKVGKC